MNLKTRFFSESEIKKLASKESFAQLMPLFSDMMHCRPGNSFVCTPVDVRVDYDIAANASSPQGDPRNPLFVFLMASKKLCTLASRVLWAAQRDCVLARC